MIFSDSFFIYFGQLCLAEGLLELNLLSLESFGLLRCVFLFSLVVSGYFNILFVRGFLPEFVFGVFLLKFYLVLWFVHSDSAISYLRKIEIYVLAC